MFVVLRLISPEKNLIKRRRQRKNIRNSSVTACTVEKSLPFFTLDVLEEKRGVDWENVRIRCGRYSTRIVAPRSCLIPDNSGIKRYIPSFANSLLVFNTALETLEKSMLPPENLCITVTDRFAVHYPDVCKLLPFASTLRIITSHPERYAEACVRAYVDYGASLIIRSNYEPVSKPEVIISCDGTVTPKMKSAVIFASKKKNAGALVVYGSGVELSEKHRRIIGDDIDSVDFAGALTELCGASEYRSSVFKKTETSCNDCEDKNASKCVACRLCIKPL